MAQRTSSQVVGRAESAIRNSTTQRSDHTQRPRLFGTVAEPPLLCQEPGRIAWMSAIRGLIGDLGEQLIGRR